jgi:uncharacterized protein (TIGR00730 family)
MPLTHICVFCGSSFGRGPTYKAAAETLGRLFAERGITLVYGGARVGLMGAVADAVLDSGGEVVGVIPSSMLDREIAHEGLTKLHVVGSMHERKALMANLSQAFIALPGGFGTLEEFCEILTWGQLGLHQKPVALLNVDGYYDDLLALFHKAFNEQFIRTEHHQLIIHAADPTEILNAFASYQPPTVQKWLDPDET